MCRLVRTPSYLRVYGGENNWLYIVRTPDAKLEQGRKQSTVDQTKYERKKAIRKEGVARDGAE